MKKETLANAATMVLASCALLVTGLVVRRELFSPNPMVAVQARESATVSNWREYAAEGRAFGPAGAPVTMVIFSDFQCPACRILADSVRELRRKQPSSVRVVYRHFPLPGHRHAMDAARASECAGVQGRFEAYHDALFARQPEIGNVPWNSFAKEAGVRDLPRFDACMREGGEVASITRDLAMAQRLEVNSTPTLLMNEARLAGARPLAALERYVEQARTKE